MRLSPLAGTTCQGRRGRTAARSATTTGVVLAAALAAVAVGVGAAELVGATRLLVRLAGGALLLALVALAVAADEAATGALLAEAQEAMGHADHLLGSCGILPQQGRTDVRQAYNIIFYQKLQGLFRQITGSVRRIFWRDFPRASSSINLSR